MRCLFLYCFRFYYYYFSSSSNSTSTSSNGSSSSSSSSSNSSCSSSSCSSAVVVIVVVLHDWYNKGRGMYYPVCGMVHIKEPLLLIGKSSLCGGSGFPFSLSEWSLTICLTPYNRT